MASYSSFKKIDSEAIVDGEVVSADVNDGAVSSAKFAAGAVTNAKIAPGAVDSNKLAASLDLSGKTMTYRTVVAGDVSNSASIAGDKLGSGAAAANIGYTPLDKAGGTMTGTLRLPDGSAGSPALRSTGDANTGLYFPGDNQVAVSINGADAMRVDSDGRVRYPRKPAFAAVGQPGWLYANSYGGTGDRELNSIMNWNLAHQYGGSNFNTSNGRFTAPISGWYHFSTMWYFLNQTNGTDSYVHSFFRKNGSVNTSPSSRIPYNINMHGNRNNYDDGANYSSIQYLNSGQYVSLCIRWHRYNGRHHAGHQVFSGQLIG